MTINDNPQGKDDFKYKMSICFRESKETNYWLRIIREAGIEKRHILSFIFFLSTLVTFNFRHLKLFLQME